MLIFNKLQDDKGAANTVSFMVIIFFVMLMLISFLDVGIYFNVKNEMQAAAENGARNVALYGGTGTSLRGAGNRGGSRGGVASAEDVVMDSIRSKFKPGGPTTGMVDASKTNVECNPPTSTAGDPVECVVTYTYLGLAKDFGMFKLRDGGVTKVKGTAVSEVTAQ